MCFDALRRQIRKYYVKKMWTVRGNLFLLRLCMRRCGRLTAMIFSGTLYTVHKGNISFVKDGRIRKKAMI